jgi:hypothetical protein
MGNNPKETDNKTNQKPVVDSNKKDNTTEHSKINSGQSSDKKQEKYSTDEDLTQSKVVADSSKKNQREEETSKGKSSNEKSSTQTDSNKPESKKDNQHTKK